MLNYSPSESVQNFQMRFLFKHHCGQILAAPKYHNIICFICDKRVFKRVDDSFRICIFSQCLIEVNCRTIADNKRVIKRLSDTLITVKQANRYKTKSPQNTYFAHLSVSV